METADPETITFEQFYELFPKEFTKSQDDFRQRLIQHSKFLENTGLESSLCSSSDSRLQEGAQEDPQCRLQREHRNLSSTEA